MTAHVDGTAALPALVAPFLGILLGAGAALAVFARSRGAARTSLATRLGIGAAVFALVAAMTTLAAPRIARDAGAPSLAAALIAAGFAHRELFRRTALVGVGEGWRAVCGWLGVVVAVVAALAVLGIGRVFLPQWIHLFGGGSIVATWLVLLVRSRRPREVVFEGHPVPAQRTACPRCGRWFDRGLGRAPCPACGLFVRYELAAGEAGREEDSARTGLHCAGCGVLLELPRGVSTCPRCDQRLCVSWNVHADSETRAGTAIRSHRGS